MSPMLVDQPKCDKLCDFKMAECNRKFKKYVAYFCHANADTKWVMKWINTLESEKYGIKCGEYDRNFSCGGKYITDLFQEFLENSHHVVVVLSPEFVQSKWSMYQLNLAVQYSINNNGSIVPLMIKSVAVPDCLKCFEMVDATKKQWFVQLLERLCSPAVRVPKLKPFCTREGHKVHERSTEVFGQGPP
ncbi:toll-like receptor 1 isoform X2 [Haliotis rufescens]|uniref:toll-like receptor 1 isoform X2 n=1 Tax=Haliotis rufescens TaxID=6454 RepID=UPI00201F2849|nr:toll-like receptor 1 isoform X2 [Haliotis rufescens]